MTETMDTEIHDVREELKRFYGKRRFAQMEEDLKQKVEAEQKRECEKAFKAGEESGFKAGEESGFKAGEESGFKAGEESGFKAGEENNTITVVTRMFNNGFTVESIMSACDLSEQEVIAIRDHGCLPNNQ